MKRIEGSSVPPESASIHDSRRDKLGNLVVIVQWAETPMPLRGIGIPRIVAAPAEIRFVAKRGVFKLMVVSTVRAAEVLGEVDGLVVLADHGYDSDAIRQYISGNDEFPNISGRKNRKKPPFLHHNKADWVFLPIVRNGDSPIR